MLLHALVLFPFAAAIIIALSGDRDGRGAARLSLVLAAVWLVMGLPLLAADGVVETEAMRWFTLWGTGAPVQYQLRADGLSIWLLQLVIWLVPVAILGGMRAAGDRLREVASLVFVCAGMMAGLLLTTDLVIFYCFYEGMLLPMLLLIWLHGDDDRRPAGMRFFIMTMLASVFMLVGVWYVAAHCGSTDIRQLPDLVGNLDQVTRCWLCLAFLLAFAVKIPLLPLHGWQAPVYAAAPTAGAVLLSGAMAKMGIYGLLRLVLPLFPDEIAGASSWLLAIAGVGVIYGALMALAQQDLKRLLAYSSLGHLGMIAFGVFSRDPLALGGVVVAMVAHGLSVGALFVLVGWLEQQAGHRRIDGFGGVVKQAPLVGVLLIMAGLTLIALPGTAGFLGELGIILGALRGGVPLWAVAVVGLSVIFGAWYLLRMVQQVVFGETPSQGRLLATSAGPEALAVVPLLLLSLCFGFWAAPMTSAADTSLSDIALPIAAEAAPAAPAAPAATDAGLLQAEPEQPQTEGM